MRAILADGERTVRNALRILLTQDLDVQVLGEADTLEALQRQVRQHQPELAVVDWGLAAHDGAGVLAGLRALSPGLRVVVVGLRPDMRAAAISCGADAFVSKVDPPAEVVLALGAPGPCAPSTTVGRASQEDPGKIDVRGSHHAVP
jgi:two-component system invasion response regulator UvrY